MNNEFCILNKGNNEKYEIEMDELLIMHIKQGKQLKT